MGTSVSIKNKCIFCKDSGMSKEHFWPEWISSYIQNNRTGNHISEIHSSEGKKDRVLDRQIKRPGNVITKKLRVVCKSCNNGWMSQLEERVKPILVAILENKSITIKKDDLLFLSKWVAMKVIVAEQSEDGTQVTPDSDRDEFFQSGKIPDYFRVYIGLQETEHTSGYLRHSLTFSITKDGPTPSLDGLQRNTQTVSFIIGPLFIFVVAARVDNFELVQAFNLETMQCIWPKENNELNWPLVKKLNQAEMSNVAYALDDFISLYNIKYGGPLPQK